eukprot:6112532-Prymnesium_polylepis.1
MLRCDLLHDLPPTSLRPSGPLIRLTLTLFTSSLRRSVSPDAAVAVEGAGGAAGQRNGHRRPIRAADGPSG